MRGRVGAALHEEAQGLDERLVRPPRSSSSAVQHRAFVMGDLAHLPDERLAGPGSPPTSAMVARRPSRGAKLGQGRLLVGPADEEPVDAGQGLRGGVRDA